MVPSLSAALLLLIPLNLHSLRIENNNLCIPSDYVIDYDYFNSYVEFEVTVKFRVFTTVPECIFDVETSVIESYQIQYEKQETSKKKPELLYYEGKVGFRFKDENFDLNIPYTITFKGRFKLYHSTEGFAIRFYREQTTMKRTWYTMYKFDPNLCGRGFMCLNSPSLHAKYKFIISHIDTHSMICTGDFVSISTDVLQVPLGLVQTTCETNENVLPNDVYILISTFARQEIENNMRIIAPFHVGHVFPLAGKWFRNLIIAITKEFTITWHKLDWLLMPHDSFRKEYIVKNACFFSIQLVTFPGSPILREQAYKCVFNQLYKYQHYITDWSNLWIIEGIIEFMSLQHQKNMTGDQLEFNHYHIVDGPDEELESMVKSKTGQRRKASGIFQMLNGVSKKAADVYKKIITTPDITSKPLSGILREFDDIKQDLGFATLEHFEEMLLSWTQPYGYPIIVANIRQDTLCVTQEDDGPDHFKSYILPIKSTFGRNLKDIDFGWTDPKKPTNCFKVLYPYLINFNMSVIARVQYNIQNYMEWADFLKDHPKHLPPFAKARLINDLCYHVKTGREDLSTLLPFLHTLYSETTSDFWATIEPTLDYLDMKLRYSQYYEEFRLLLAGSFRQYFSAMEGRLVPEAMAVKWACALKLEDCVKYAELEVHGVVEYYGTTPLEETICAGMRTMDKRTISIIERTIGLPDIRDPVFYIEMLTCIEDRIYQRKFLNSLFQIRDYPLPPRIKKELLVKMIRASKSGLDTVMLYVRDTPISVFEDLEVDYFLDLLEVIADYLRDQKYMKHIDKLLDIKALITPGQQQRFDRICEKVHNNTVWMQTNYDVIKKFFVDDHTILMKIYNNALHK